MSKITSSYRSHQQALEEQAAKENWAKEKWYGTLHKLEPLPKVGWCRRRREGGKEGGLVFGWSFLTHIKI